ncbi:MAG: hypothetical protein IIA45_01380 [Bacteroidetes bacterium]|nr:hypothetical protein [Bacteroidota bacterium]
MFRVNYATVLLLFFSLILTAGSIEGKPPKLTEETLQHLKSFARLYGYVRYFHPSDEAASNDWPSFVLYSIIEIEKSRDIKKTFENLFYPIAPLVMIHKTGEDVSYDTSRMIPENISGLKTAAWQHLGVKLSFKYSYKSLRINRGQFMDSMLFEQYPQVGDLIRKPIGSGLSCIVPLAVLTSKSYTYPKADQHAYDIMTEKMNYEMIFGTANSIRTTRLAAVIISWNVLQHFYPYFDDIEIKMEWDLALSEAMHSAATDKAPSEFKMTLEKMIGYLQDGHGTVYKEKMIPFYYPPIMWDWVDNKLVITEILDNSTSLEPGDQIIRINGKKIKKLYEKELSLISGSSPQRVQQRFNYRMLRGKNASEIKLRHGTHILNRRSVTLSRTIHQAVYSDNKPKHIEIDGNILYVNMMKASYYDIYKLLPRMSGAKAVIFDLRGYPNKNTYVLCHLIEDTVYGPLFLRSKTIYPDRENILGYDSTGTQVYKPFKPEIRTQIIFLSDENAISQSETILSIVKHYNIGIIIGEPTAGTNGFINEIFLPGGYVVRFTGLKAVFQDGSPLFGIGVQPTIQVSPTLKGIKSGRDEILERAIKEIK